ncbi:arginase [Sugiyamaella lignohabitans]|uniref:Arginase n=1 Tax=Sugiyamaella lignohabitans TaxID=796027 RepID=A0A167E7D0_9ASCO|nr:arginase [Sugiyamaella lignohabitans]ANB13731.1 arginase [Sugiyamaella lignohabitans]
MTISQKSRSLTVISAPFSGGQGKPGVDDGPQHLLDMGLVEQIGRLDWTPKFAGHLQFPAVKNDTNIGHVKNPRYVSQSTKNIYEAVKKASTSSDFTLTIGGDHSIAIGTVAGVQAAHPDAIVLWIDAHADLNTPAASSSGNLHGCPVAFLLGADEPLANAASKEEADLFGWVPHCLDDSQLGYIGLRDVDAFEKQYIREHKIAAFSMHHVDKYGIASVVEQAINKLDPEHKRPIHLSFDVDAIDPVYAPSTGTPVRGGLTWREACYLCEAVAETGRLVAMDLVECNPHLEDAKAARETIAMGLSLVRCALGETLL